MRADLSSTRSRARIVLREARSLLRRADKPKTAVGGLEDATSARLAAELCQTAKALTDALARFEAAKQASREERAPSPARPGLQEFFARVIQLAKG